MTEIELIIDLHQDTDRQGPGSESDTLKALEFIHFPESRQLEVADIGCGTGGQTITLAQNIQGHITAVDLFPEFLRPLSDRAKRLGLEYKIRCLEKSMEDLSFAEKEFDLIWSEGAIYIMGFENGIKQWKRFLKDGGYLAISEITWTTNSRPDEINDFWSGEYPEIDTASNKIKILENNGFSLMGYFTLSQDSWMTNYYMPLETRFDAFLERHKNSDLARKIVGDYQSEIELYKRFKAFYSYGFYIAKKTEEL